MRICPNNAGVCRKGLGIKVGSTNGVFTNSCAACARAALVAPGGTKVVSVAPLDPSCGDRLEGGGSTSTCSGIGRACKYLAGLKHLVNSMETQRPGEHDGSGSSEPKV